MQIPHEVTARPDTGLYNAKLGIWLFLASEVMLFGGLFSAYIFMRLGAEPGTWPYGKYTQDIIAGCFNTAILILSSVTVLYAWASLKLRQFNKARWFLVATFACAVIFLGVKSVEYYKKFNHFGAFVTAEAFQTPHDNHGKQTSLQSELKAMDANVVFHEVSQTFEVTGHLENPGVFGKRDFLASELELAKASGDTARATDLQKQIDGLMLVIAPDERFLIFGEHGHVTDEALPHGQEAASLSPTEIKAIEAVEGHPIAAAEKEAHASDHGHATIAIPLKDVWRSGYWFPEYSSYMAIYYTMTGLHALHVIGGALVLLYFAVFGMAIYKKNPEHQANRVEVGGLFWHFVDLVWIFLFPILYLL